MSNKIVELTASQLARRIDNEGLEYAVVDYYGPNIQCTDDPQMEALWKAAYNAIEALRLYAGTIKDDDE